MAKWLEWALAAGLPSVGFAWTWLSGHLSTFVV